MKELLVDIGFTLEEIEGIKPKLEIIGQYKVESIVFVLKRYGCSNLFIKEIINKRIDILDLDKDILSYTLEAITSNGDLIEDVLLDII
jgi:hypothetical protein